MESFCTRVFLLLLFCNSINGACEKEENTNCKKLAQNPFFCNHMVVNKIWRVFHMWEHKVTCQECIPGEVYFSHGTPEVVRRVRINMQDRLQEEPDWRAMDTSSLVMTTEKERHEIVMTGDLELGYFHGPPNIIRKEPIQLGPQRTPLKKFQMKILNDGKILLIADCVFGSAWLLARPKDAPSLKMLADITKFLDMGPGATCSY